MPVSLQDQSVLVVGASSGIGRAVAVEFARHGARVMAAARRENRLAELKDQLAREAHPIETFAADAADAARMAQLVAATMEQFGGLNILVYATGTNFPDRSMKRLTPEIWNTMIAVNLSGAFYCTHAALPVMRAAGGGQLIYISSVSGRTSDISGAAYQASKRGLLALAGAIRVEEKQHGIRPCVICPGLVRTEILDKRPEKTPEEIIAKAMEPEDVAEIVLDVARLNPRAIVTELEIMPTYL